jgi:predicted phage tail protein
MNHRHHSARRVLARLAIATTVLLGGLAMTSTAHAAPVFNFYDTTWRHGTSPFVNSTCGTDYYGYSIPCVVFMSRVDVHLANGVAPKVGETFMVHLDVAIVAPITLDEYMQMRVIMPAGLQPAITKANPLKCVTATIKTNTVIGNAPCGLTKSGVVWQLPAVHLANGMEADYFIPVVATKTFAGTATQDCSKSAVIHLGVCLQSTATIGSSSYLPNPMVSAVPLTVSVPSKPGAPVAVSGSPRNGAAVVTWSAPLSNGGKPITKYTVTAAPGGHTCVTTGARTCAVMGLANAHAYTFTVKATNVLGTGGTSAKSAAVLVGTPTAPRSPKVTLPKAATFKITWLAPLYTGSGPVTRYEIRARGTADGVTWTGWIPWYKLKTTPSYSDAGATYGVLYEVQLRAVNASGASAPVTFRFLQTK